jgi:NADH-quinone oxidoreductase subunit H
MGIGLFEFIVNTVKIALVFFLLISTVPQLVWIERRASAFMQNRLGPNRVGPLGLFQLIADAIKFIFKEEFIPSHSDKILYFMAPGLAVLPAMLTFAAVPMATPFTIFGHTINMQIADLNVGVIYILAVGSLGVYGVLTAGWASGNKYSMMGALRASSQMISYEIAMGLSLVGVLLLFKTFSLNEMIAAQTGSFSFNWQGIQHGFKYLPNWGIFYQPLAFLLFMTAGFAETNRIPFDLPEGEAELVAGYHTEYGGFKFNMFFMGEYGHMITASALLATMFFGGYALPFISPEQVLQFWTEHGAGISNAVHLPVNEVASLLTMVTHLVTFLIKTGFWLFFYVWVRWTLPRFRYDHLMDLGWKTLLPWALVNLVITTTVMFLAHVNQ